MVSLDKQSTDIAMGVDKAKEAKDGEMTDAEIEAIGAGDQGMMFGYASNETEEYMPYPISLAHKLTKKLTEVRKDGTLTYLRPDGKSQVSVEYDENGKPYRLEAVVLSTQHDAAVTQEQILFGSFGPRTGIVRFRGCSTFVRCIPPFGHLGGCCLVLSQADLELAAGGGQMDCSPFPARR